VYRSTLAERATPSSASRGTGPGLPSNGAPRQSPTSAPTSAPRKRSVTSLATPHRSRACQVGRARGRTGAGAASDGDTAPGEGEADSGVGGHRRLLSVGRRTGPRGAVARSAVTRTARRRSTRARPGPTRLADRARRPPPTRHGRRRRYRGRGRPGHHAGARPEDSARARPPPSRARADRNAVRRPVQGIMTAVLRRRGFVRANPEHCSKQSSPRRRHFLLGARAWRARDRSGSGEDDVRRPSSHRLSALRNSNGGRRG
jgi:hypothetical protein